MRGNASQTAAVHTTLRLFKHVTDGLRTTLWHLFHQARPKPAGIFTFRLEVGFDGPFLDWLPPPLAPTEATTDKNFCGGNQQASFCKLPLWIIATRRDSCSRDRQTSRRPDPVESFGVDLAPTDDQFTEKCVGLKRFTAVHGIFITISAVLTEPCRP
jgi:hypothetical protein